MDTRGYASWFRESTPYISQHRNKTFVVLLGGDAIDHPNLVNIVHDLALAHVLGLKLVVIHGGRPQLDAALGQRVDGLRRVTRPQDMTTVTGVFGQIRTRLEAMFSTGIPSSPLRNADICVTGGNFVAARPLGIIDGTDYQLTGLVRRIHTHRIQNALDTGAIALLSPAGYSSSGQVYNLAADELAAEAAVAMNAEKLIVFDECGGVMSGGSILPTVTPTELNQRLADVASPVTRTRLQALGRAVRGGIPRGVILGFAQDGALLTELFTAEGHGTQVREDLTGMIRPAGLDDVASIVEVIRPLEQTGVLVRRSRDRLEQELERFLVAEIDSVVVGCCAVYPHERLAELACVAVSESYRGISQRHQSVGDALLQAAERNAASLGADGLFVLTTQAEDWFRDRGFEAAVIADLPGEKRALYNYQRNSKILLKSL